jgi:hypothetical protein
VQWLSTAVDVAIVPFILVSGLFGAALVAGRMVGRAERTAASAGFWAGILFGVLVLLFLPGSDTSERRLDAFGWISAVVGLLLGSGVSGLVPLLFGQEPAPRQKGVAMRWWMQAPSQRWVRRAIRRCLKIALRLSHKVTFRQWFRSVLRRFLKSPNHRWVSILTAGFSAISIIGLVLQITHAELRGLISTYTLGFALALLRRLMWQPKDLALLDPPITRQP